MSSTTPAPAPAPAPLPTPFSVPLTWQLGVSYFLFILGSFYAFFPHSFHVTLAAMFGIGDVVPHNVHILLGLIMLGVSIWLMNSNGIPISAYITDMTRFEIIAAATAIAIILDLLFSKLNPAFQMSHDLSAFSTPLVLGSLASYFGYMWAAAQFPGTSNLIWLGFAAMAGTLVDLIPEILAGGMSIQLVIMSFIFQSAMLLIPLAGLFEYLQL